MKIRTLTPPLLGTALMLVAGTSHARWMNPNTGRFQTMDSYEGDQEQPITLHKYLYVGGNPVNRIDPSGLYEIDVHQFLTWYLARAAGFAEADANAIGLAAQALDAPGSSRDAIQWYGASQGNMRDWHFVSWDRLEELRSGIFSTTLNPKNVGDYLHALQDTFSHSEGNSYLSVFGDYYQDGGPLNLGHAFHGHEPDWTWTNIPKAMDMARATYNALVAVRGYTSPAQGGPKQSWSQVESKVRAFASFTPDLYNQAWLGGLKSVKTVTYEGINKKVQILDPSFTLDTLDSRYRKVYGDAVQRRRSQRSFQTIQSIGEAYSSSFYFGF